MPLRLLAAIADIFGDLVWFNWTTAELADRRTNGPGEIHDILHDSLSNKRRMI